METRSSRIRLKSELPEILEVMKARVVKVCIKTETEKYPEHHNPIFMQIFSETASEMKFLNS